MDFSAGEQDEYKKIMEKFIGNGAEEKTAAGIHKIGESDTSAQSALGNVVYMLKNSEIKYKKTNVFNMLLDEVEDLEKYGPFYATKMTKDINALPNEIDVAKRALKVLDHTSNFASDPKSKPLIIRAAVFTGLAAALYNKHNVTSLIYRAKEAMTQYNEKVYKSLEQMNKESLEPAMLEKVRLAKKMVNLKLMFMIAIAIVLILVLHYLLYKDCDQKKKAYKITLLHKPLHPGKKIMDSIINNV